MTSRRLEVELGPSRISVSMLAILLIASAMTFPGCSRTEAPETEAPSANALFVPDTKPVPQVKWRDAIVPEGTTLKVSLIDTLSSRESHAGDPFRALLSDAVLVDGSVVVPSGSNARGIVRTVVPAEDNGRPGSLVLEFNQIDTPTGASAPLVAKIGALLPGRSAAILASGSVPGELVGGAAGRDAILMSNTEMTVVLTRPLQIKVKE